MIRGRVIGEVWATRKAPGWSGGACCSSASTAQDRAMVAIDTLDAREGEAVMVSVGSGARNVLAARPGQPRLLCDAAISLIIDGEG